MDKISAFMDGESASAETRNVIERLRSDQECRKIWDSFHLVGDVMRGAPVLRDDFIERLRQKLEDEPTVLAPHAKWRSLNKFAYSAAAAAAGVAVVLALAMTNNSVRLPADIATARPADSAQLAQNAVSTARAQPDQVANSKQVNEYLMAHLEFSPRTALQGVVPYVRSVSSSHDGNKH